MLTEEQIAELKTKYGNDTTVIDGPVGLIVVKKPGRLAYDKYQDAIFAKTSFSAAARELAQSCLLFPDWGTFLSALDAEPTLLTGEVLSAINELAGSRTEHDVKKL